MFSEETLFNFTRKYTSEIASTELLGVSHNTVYKVNCDKPFVLRITSSRHRNISELLSEVNFILFLSSRGVPVSTPILSLSGDIITEYALENDTLFIVAFTLADGLQWDGKDGIGNYRDDSYYLERIGRALGKIHKASLNYHPENGVFRRQYSESQHLQKAYGIFEKYNTELYKRYKVFMHDLSLLGKTSENFGLTHGDFLMSNYNISADNKVIVYDFDECEYSWFISDVAVFLYYHITGPDPLNVKNKNHEAIKTILLFMSGYLSENDLPLTELKHLNLFFVLRDYILLSAIVEKGEGNFGWWDEKLIKAAIPRILGGENFIDINIDLIIQQLDKDS